MDVQSTLTGPVALTNFLELLGVQQVINPADKRAEAGVFKLTATWRNISSESFADLFAEVVVLTNGNVLLNADNGVGGVGSTLTMPAEALSPDGVLSPNETFTQTFEVGLQTQAPSSSSSKSTAYSNNLVVPSFLMVFHFTKTNRAIQYENPRLIA